MWALCQRYALVVTQALRSPRHTYRTECLDCMDRPNTSAFPLVRRVLQRGPPSRWCVPLLLLAAVVAKTQRGKSPIGCSVRPCCLARRSADHRQLPACVSPLRRTAAAESLPYAAAALPGVCRQGWQPLPNQHIYAAGCLLLRIIDHHQEACAHAIAAIGAARLASPPCSQAFWPAHPLHRGRRHGSEAGGAPPRPAMAVLLETSKGDIVIDLFCDDCPLTCKNFLKLCKCARGGRPGLGSAAPVGSEGGGVRPPDLALHVCRAGSSSTTTACSIMSRATSWFNRATPPPPARAARPSTGGCMHACASPGRGGGDTGGRNWHVHDHLVACGWAWGNAHAAKDANGRWLAPTPPAFPHPALHLPAVCMAALGACSKLYGDQARFFDDEIRPHLRHRKRGVVGMASPGANLNASQFYITTGEELDSLDEKHTVFGQVRAQMHTYMHMNACVRARTRGCLHLSNDACIATLLARRALRTPACISSCRCMHDACTHA